MVNISEEIEYRSEWQTYFISNIVKDKSGRRQTLSAWFLGLNTKTIDLITKWARFWVVLYPWKAKEQMTKMANDKKGIKQQLKKNYKRMTHISITKRKEMSKLWANDKKSKMAE